jgi:hypothetical protein
MTEFSLIYQGSLFSILPFNASIKYILGSFYTFQLASRPFFTIALWLLGPDVVKMKNSYSI